MELCISGWAGVYLQRSDHDTVAADVVEGGPVNLGLHAVFNVQAGGCQVFESAVGEIATSSAIECDRGGQHTRIWSPRLSRDKWQLACNSDEAVRRHGTGIGKCQSFEANVFDQLAPSPRSTRVVQRPER